LPKAVTRGRWWPGATPEPDFKYIDCCYTLLTELNACWPTFYPCYISIPISDKKKEKMHDIRMTIYHFRTNALFIFTEKAGHTTGVPYHLFNSIETIHDIILYWVITVLERPAIACAEELKQRFSSGSVRARLQQIQLQFIRLISVMARLDDHVIGHVTFRPVFFSNHINYIICTVRHSLIHSSLKTTQNPVFRFQFMVYVEQINSMDHLFTVRVPV